MKVFTKLFLTFALLCFAGVVNAATEYEVDQKFTSVAALEGQSFAIVNETDGKAVFGSGAQNLGYDLITTAVTGSGNSGYYFKLEASTVEGAYLLRLQTPAGEPYNIWGNPGYLNTGDPDGTHGGANPFNGCFILGLNNQNGQDIENGAVWEIEYAEGQGFALKNKGLGGYFAGPNPAPTATEPIYWTFCTLKEGAEIPDPVIEEPEAPLAEGELIPDFFSICDEGAIPYGYAVKFGTEDRAYPNTYTGGARMFNFAEGGDFTKAIYFREGYVQYGDVKKLALEAGKKYIVHFNSAMWKSSGADMTFLIYKEGDLENAVLTQTIANTPDVNGSKDAVTGSTASEIEFTPDADGNYILKWNASGWKEVLLANPGVKVAPAAPAEGTEITLLPSDLTEIENAEFTGSKDDVNISCTQGTVTADQIRVFKNQTITFSSTKAIKKIVFTCTANGTAKYGPGCFNEQEGYTFEAEGNTGTWEGSAASVSFKAETNQVRLSQVVITLGDETVEPVHIANTIDDPYTIAKAVELIDAGQALDETVFVKGIISKIDKVNIDEEDATKSYITYWISDNGSEEGQQFECYKGLSMEGLALDAIEVGAEVIVTGKLTKYNDIYEFSAGNAIVAYVAPVKPLFADGKYYILNKGTEKYLAAGSNWGTHAFVNAEGLDYTLAFADGKYTLDSQVSNGGNNHFLNGEWNDGAAMGWTFAEVAEGVYTISNGTAYLTAGEDGRVTLAADATVAAAQWTLVAAADRDAANLATLEAATAENGVDATFLVKGANFNRNDLRNQAWTATKSGGNQTIGGPNGDRATYGCESWNNTFEVSQTIENLPEGVYEFTIAGYGTNGTTKIFANDTEVAFVNTEGAANFGAAVDAIAAGQYAGNTTGKVMVIEGSALKIGVKRTEQVGADWTVFDNARLTYFGAIPAEEFAPAYAAALAAAQAALANEDYAAVTGEEKTALEKAIADYAEIAEPTAELYKAAIAALTSATTAFTSAKAAYETFNATAASLADVLFPYAAPAKKAAAEASTAAAPKSAAEATALTEAVLKAYRQYAESSALLECQYGAAVNMTDFIVNPNAEEAIAEPWAVVLGEGSGGSLNILDGEPLTDGDGNSAYKYFDGGNWGGTAWDVALEQTITLPAGKYYLTAAGRAAENVTLTLFAGENTAEYNTVGASGALFGRGWSDASVEFEMAEEGTIKIGVRGVTENQYQWMSFTRFRLMQFGVAGEDAPELQAPEGWNNEIANGNLAGDNVDSYASKEYPAPDPSASTIVAMAGKDFSRGIVVKAQDKVSQAWDSQFWIVLNEELPAGATLHVEFDYKADKAGSVSTQSHAAPGGYLHWACIGNVNFTTEWQHFSAEVTVDAAANNMKSIAFNLNDIAEANNYYFDNFGVWAKIPEKPKEWENIIVNSDMEGTDNSCFYVTEQGVGGPFLAPFTAGIGVNGSKAVKVQSADNPTNSWDTQFFIRLPYQLPAGTQYKVQFDYKADEAAKSTTQAHANPGDYIHYVGIGDVNFTADWQSFEFESIISADQSKEDKPMQSIAFNLAELKTANVYIFDNVKFFVPKDIVSSLNLNPAVDPQPYPEPDGISTLKNQKNVEGMYNLNGQKVNKAQKGLYIMNGKKVVVK